LEPNGSRENPPFENFLFRRRWIAPAVRGISLQGQRYGSFEPKHFLNLMEVEVLKNSLDGATEKPLPSW